MCQINKYVPQKNSTYFLPNYLPQISGIALMECKWLESLRQLFSGRNNKNNKNNLNFFHHFPNFYLIHVQQNHLIQTICLDFPDFLVKLKKKKTITKNKTKTKKQTNNSTVWWDVNVAKSRQFCKTDQILLQTRLT